MNDAASPAMLTVTRNRGDHRGMPPLVPCPNCSVHAKSTEKRCPPCGEVLRVAAGTINLSHPISEEITLALYGLKEVVDFAQETDSSGLPSDLDEYMTFPWPSASVSRLFTLILSSHQLFSSIRR